MSNAGIPPTAAERGKIAPAKLAHVVIRTVPDRLEEVAAWYRCVLEAETLFGNPLVQFMTYDEEHHRLAVVGVPGLGERTLQTVGVDHFAFAYAGLADWIHTYERLKAEGIVPAMTIHHGPTLSLYYLDPDRNQIELQIDAFDTAEELAEFMRGGQFASNPIGVFFDPDEMAKRFHDGVPEGELRKPIPGSFPDLGKFPIH